MAAAGGKQWLGVVVKQVTKKNFADSLREFKDHVDAADFIAVSTKKTGDSASAAGHRRPWWRVLPIDTPEVAYLKAKLAAESYEILQFAICPFRIFQGSKVVAYPYNFHLFPRDELNLGMPSYTFSCQTSFLTSMAEEGFDFNGCVHHGISYLSRVQESIVKAKNPVPQVQPVQACSGLTVADSIFMSRIKSRVENWRNACKDTSNVSDGSLVKSLRKLILGDEKYGSRPSISVDVCTNRQAKLALQVEFIGTSPRCFIDMGFIALQGVGDSKEKDKSGEPKTVRVVLTISEEDKSLLMGELELLEEQQNLKIRGFRQVIDLISSSYKPIVGYNCLHDFAFIHSKFLAPLPSSLNEFLCSLRLVFPDILDVNYLMKEIGPLKKAKNLAAALHYLRRQFFLPIDLELPSPLEATEANIYNGLGSNVLRLARFFSKLSILLRLVPSDRTGGEGLENVPIEKYSNMFYPIFSNHQPETRDDDNDKNVNTDNIIFFWGFSHLMPLVELKQKLRHAHSVFSSEDFVLQPVDQSCAVAVFEKSGSASALLDEMRSDDIAASTGLLSEMVSEGLRAAGYDAYRKICEMGLWEADLADSLEKVSISASFHH